MLWSELLAERIRSACGSKVTLINPAVGGTTLSQNIVTMQTWQRAGTGPGDRLVRRQLITMHSH